MKKSKLLLELERDFSYKNIQEQVLLTKEDTPRQTIYIIFGDGVLFSAYKFSIFTVSSVRQWDKEWLGAGNVLGIYSVLLDKIIELEK